MLSRRHIRIKVFQSIYAYNTISAEERTPNDSHSLLLHLVEQPDKIYKNYIRLLALVLALKDKAIADADIRSSKFLPKAEDKDANKNFINNALLQVLDQNIELKKACNNFKLGWNKNDEVIGALFQKLKKATFYTDYLSIEASFEQDVKLVNDIYSKLIEKSEEVDNFFDDKGFKENIDSVRGNKVILSQFSDLTWHTDRALIFEMIHFTLKKVLSKTSTPQSPLAVVVLNWEDDKKFLEQLFRISIAEVELANDLIERFAKNWDIERIAIVDRILMQMAIAEWMTFPSIPVNVTMNEYIDIAKSYSTPQSKSFLNGVLDQILLELKNQDKIKKEGRGLINSKK